VSKSVRPAAVPRLATGIDELERVLGGGLVPGSVVLVAGEPGVGKSTFALQLATRGRPPARGRRAIGLRDVAPAVRWLRASSPVHSLVDDR
jgi:serine kinase of HPr protein (carbohydrate metabolism regulator)